MLTCQWFYLKKRKFLDLLYYWLHFEENFYAFLFIIKELQQKAGDNFCIDFSFF